MMSRFFVLHLSDLHINETIPDTLYKLIKSISANKDLQNSNLIMTITGDIVNRADYENSLENTIEFFELLKKEVDKSKINICDVIIVPGNHDKVVDASNKLFSIAQQSGINYSKEAQHLPTEQEVIALQSKGFEKHLELCNKIFKIFDIKRNKKEYKTYDCSYGVECVELGTSTIAFIRINTALSCYGCPKDGEKYHLTLSRYQLDVLKKQYRKVKNNCKNVLLTFGLAHHPISYMVSKEAAIINKFLISDDLLNVDYFLSGHIHDGSLTNLSNHNRSMVSLETGIGWPDDPESTNRDHRYAIYCFDEERNVFSSTMYKTNQANEFCVDYDHLITAQEKENGKIYSPLKTRDYAFIKLNDYNVEDNQYLFVNSDSINTLKLLFSTIRDFSSFCTKLLPEYLNKYIDFLLMEDETSDATEDFIAKNFNEIFISDEQKYNETKNFNTFLNSVYSVPNNQDILQKIFEAYLQHVCQIFHESFKQYFDNISECRAVFRLYSKKSDNYKPIATYPHNTSPRSDFVKNKTGLPRSYEYSHSLIECAFKNNQSLVYSLNMDKHNFEPDNWDDFIVMVPPLENYSIRNTLGQFDSRPAIVFVFSVRLINSEKCETDETYQEKLKKQAHRLFLLQFSEVEKIISSVILEFIEKMPIKIKEFIDSKEKEGI